MLGKTQVLWHRTKAEAPFWFSNFHQIPVHTKTWNPKKHENLELSPWEQWSSKHLRTCFHKAPLTRLEQKITDPRRVNCCWQLELFQWKCLISNRDISSEEDIGNPALKQLLFLMLSPPWELMSLHKTDFAGGRRELGMERSELLQVPKIPSQMCPIWLPPKKPLPAGLGHDPATAWHQMLCLDLWDELLCCFCGVWVRARSRAALGSRRILSLLRRWSLWMLACSYLHHPATSFHTGAACIFYILSFLWLS